ncbi:ACP S-malonyltransferase [Taylorella equigenitalis]|uniref:Malonyl CoA-acyl carrier protein transacylase n=2 Tax=Taylorella equigenitalis TaxID=29575 RepID=A0A654KHX9_TAYEM|nr:ACP S-malonyltransferase [Taylorella equigenitalis]ADU92022.1 Malonyl CoA-acyl carrier protein transacylase [Taylorella equigenitalis MCE9]AFN35584.1 malonyl coA-acyl carrier protein transacylase [Taylorella equigenitalis ATCC 35865]ASY30238.1 malonyl CoA-acyl carrier protein transacylase [Taylorella equigenitalis]ASY37541.1 [acyl-carrier-protein] S-malonyltransferase [Taylorella equigenitalis]ASY39010.1 malonyl CoA-acyl carrier protein transacylase [Taylorella equigenitalis]
MKIAIVFPGQGSQTIGMLDSWVDSPVVQNVLKKATEALGQDIATLIHEGPEHDLNLTTNTQPVMLASSYALYKAYEEAGLPQASVMAGHSLGEYTALTASGVFQLEDVVKIVRVRANSMQDVVPVGSGGMAAIIGLSDEKVIETCRRVSEQSGEVVEAVNFNAPSQVVIAGHKAAVVTACEVCKQEGAKRALVLPVSAPFHSSLLEPAARVLESELSKYELQKPVIPVINNVDVEIKDSPEEIVDALVRQAWHPVRWVETMQKLSDLGITHVIECGPGKVLSNLAKRILPEIEVLTINNPCDLENLKSVLS